MTLFRLLHVLWVLAAFLLWWSLARWRLVPHPEAPAQRLCRALVRLGGSFVKLGQMLGIRRDLIPDSFALELQSLQDRVPPFPAREARAVIEREFGKGMDDIFDRFEDDTLAAASLAQVHRARLHDGRDVVVKVRRPGVKAGISRDLHLLYVAVRVLVTIVPGLQRYRPGELVRELAYNLRRELDFRVEAHSIRRFREGMKALSTVFVPDVVDDLYTERVLVTQLSGGCRVDDPRVADGPAMARSFVEAYLHQFFVMGFFHGDPHPGNLFIRPDGRICFHDLGLMGSLDMGTRRNLAAFVQAMVNNDTGWLVDAYLDLGVVTADVDRAELRRGLEELLKEYAALPLSRWSFAEAFLEVVRIGRVQNIRLPHNLLVFMRTAFLMENTVRSLDPEYNLVEGLVERADAIVRALREHPEAGSAGARLKFELGALAQDSPRVVSGLVRSVRERGVEIPLRLAELDKVGRDVDRAVNRLVVAMLAGVFFVAASLLMQHSIGPRLWDVPVLSMVGYAEAIWLTVRLLHAVQRAGGL